MAILSFENPNDRDIDLDTIEQQRGQPGHTRPLQIYTSANGKVALVVLPMNPEQPRTRLVSGKLDRLIKLAGAEASGAQNSK